MKSSTCTGFVYVSYMFTWIVLLDAETQCIRVGAQIETGEQFQEASFAVSNPPGENEQATRLAVCFTITGRVGRSEISHRLDLSTRPSTPLQVIE